MPVRTDTANAIAVITMDRPPVNSLDITLRRDLHAAMASALADPTIKAVILTGGPKLFSAGADIEEFAAGLTGLTFATPTLPEVIDPIEAATKPVIAAISGVCMGGGLELALGCHYRIAGAAAKFALPEVKLGILPGAGGTQRLPRAVGVAAALDMIVSGDVIDGARAAALGLASLAEGDLMEAALALAFKVAQSGVIPRLCEVAPTLPEGVSIEAFFDERLKKLRTSLPAPKACVAAVRMSVEVPFAEAVLREFDLFKGLVVTEESQALQYSFFSERAASKIDGVASDAPVRRVDSVAIIGAGTMGGGIAMCAINAGLSAVMIDQTDEALQRGLGTIRRNYEGTVKKGRLSEEEMNRRLSRLSTSTDYAAVGSADLIIEAVFEDLGVKEAVFGKLDCWKPRCPAARRR